MAEGWLDIEPSDRAVCVRMLRKTSFLYLKIAGKRQLMFMNAITTKYKEEFSHFASFFAHSARTSQCYTSLMVDIQQAVNSTFVYTRRDIIIRLPSYLIVISHTMFI